MASRPGVRGQRLLERSGRRLEPVHPEFVTKHPTATGWIWFGALAIILIVLDVARAPHAVRVAISLIAAASPIHSSPSCRGRAVSSSVSRVPVSCWSRAS